MHFTKKNSFEKRIDLKTKLNTKKLLKFPGAYNPLTAKLITEINFDGIYISGAVMANDLGIPDIGLTNIKDVRVLFDEPLKFTAKLRQNKTDNNLLLLKCELEDAGHGGKSGRDSAIEEIAFDFSFILKIAKKLNT